MSPYIMPNAISNPAAVALLKFLFTLNFIFKFCIYNFKEY